MKKYIKNSTKKFNLTKILKELKFTDDREQMSKQQSGNIKILVDR